MMALVFHVISRIPSNEIHLDILVWLVAVVLPSFSWKKPSELLNEETIDEVSLNKEGKEA